MTEGKTKLPLILVLEDEPSLREMLVFALRGAGYDAAGAETVEEALDIAVKAPPDLALVDIMMAPVEGLEFARTIRATAPAPLRDIPIIAMSGMDRVEGGEKALMAGCNHFIPKPLEPDELVRAVKRYIS